MDDNASSPQLVHRKQVDKESSLPSTSSVTTPVRSTSKKLSNHCELNQVNQRKFAKTTFWSQQKLQKFKHTAVHRLTRAHSDVYELLWQHEPCDVQSYKDGTLKCHKLRDSFLSSSRNYTNYRGLLNLCILLLVMSSGRLVLENIIKYGLLVKFDVPLRFLEDPTAWPGLFIVFCLNFPILITFFMQKLILSGAISSNTGYYINVANIFSILTVPAYYIWNVHPNPVSSAFALATASCVFLKLWSYSSINRHCRSQMLEKSTRRVHQKSESDLRDLSDDKLNEQDDIKMEKKKDKDKDSKDGKDSNDNKDSNDSRESNDSNTADLVHYPDNLTVKDLYYFMFSPTLCYELNFPRSSRIRKRFLLRRVIEMTFLAGLMLMLIQQWIVPVLRNSQKPFRQSHWPGITERLLKLAIPNHFIWLIFFYWYFHSTMNVVAEILRFGDREFYRDWWNAESVTGFWKDWNIPVHNFAVRHVYKPLITRGLSKNQASIVVFLLSAFFHEYLVSVPLRMFRLWAFFGMLFQVPFAFFVERYLKGNYANMAVWLSLIVGQPIAIMMYIHDYYFEYFYAKP